ncbi:hypothetical protein BLOT_002889 [Blomia tropicalis]|nr:hypothetical protein BLOT_002889 [Blomia tropicalis]
MPTVDTPYNSLQFTLRPFSQNFWAKWLIHLVPQWRCSLSFQFDCCFLNEKRLLGLASGQFRLVRNWLCWHHHHHHHRLRCPLFRDPSDALEEKLKFSKDIRGNISAFVRLVTAKTRTGNTSFGCNDHIHFLSFSLHISSLYYHNIRIHSCKFPTSAINHINTCARKIRSILLFSLVLQFLVRRHLVLRQLTL